MTQLQPVPYGILEITWTRDSSEYKVVGHVKDFQITRDDPFDDYDIFSTYVGPTTIGFAGKFSDDDPAFTLTTTNHGVPVRHSKHFEEW